MPGDAGRPAADVATATCSATTGAATLFCVTRYFYVAGGTNLTPGSPGSCEANCSGSKQNVAEVSAVFDPRYKHDSGGAGHLFSSIGPAGKPAPWWRHH